MNADKGDITRTKPEALRVKTSGLAASEETVIFILLYGIVAIQGYNWHLYLLEAGWMEKK
jgi:hypothetical protein